MAQKASGKTSVATKSTANTLSVVENHKQTRARQIAELALSPIVVNGSTASTFAKGSFGEIDLTAAIEVQREKVNRVNAGDLSDLEATLTVQATTLDTIFNELARRAAHNMGQHLDATELYLRLAFRAQAQCRATIETLAQVKYPKSATFIKQANIAQQQQVNNDRDPTAKPSRTEKNIDATNELLEAQHGERLDTRATGEASGGDPHMETLGAIHRTGN